MEMFVPHGQCFNIHLGGHAQTGGYGMVIAALGIMSDYIQAFEIVLANGEHKRIWRPKVPKWDLELGYPTSQENDDLFFAVMGGSPGCFGILTHIIFSPLKDKDFPNSRMMKCATLYSKEKHRAIQKVLAEMNGDMDMSPNFTVSMTLLSDIANSWMVPIYQ